MKGSNNAQRRRQAKEEAKLKRGGGLIQLARGNHLKVGNKTLTQLAAEEEPAGNVITRSEESVMEVEEDDDKATLS